MRTDTDCIVETPRQILLLHITLYMLLQTTREDDLHAMAKTLLQHETLTRHELQQVLDGTFSKVPVAKDAADAEVAGLTSGHVAQSAEHSKT